MLHGLIMGLCSMLHAIPSWEDTKGLRSGGDQLPDLGNVKQKCTNMNSWVPRVHQLTLYVGTARRGKGTKKKKKDNDARKKKKDKNAKKKKKDNARQREKEKERQRRKAAWRRRFKQQQWQAWILRKERCAAVGVSSTPTTRTSEGMC